MTETRAKKYEVRRVKVSEMNPAPYNPRIDLKPSDPEYQHIRNSVERFGYLEPIVWNERTGNIVSGHQRFKILKEQGATEIDVCVVDFDTDKEKACNLAMNKAVGLWDFEKMGDLLIELDSLDWDMTDFGFKDLESMKSDGFFSQEHHGSDEADNEEYAKFLEKFDAKKTTDDCYTPAVVYEAVADWVSEEYSVDRADFVRPFVPNGDYQAFRYEPNSVVVDNPPFSILAEILDFYLERNIKFFLFCPHLTSFGYGKRNVTIITTGTHVVYENGAHVATDFVTNLGDLKFVARTYPKLTEVMEVAIKEYGKTIHAELPKYVFPVSVITAPQLGRYGELGIDFRVPRERSAHIRKLDSMGDEAIYGSAFILSESLSLEREKAEREKAEREKAEREKAEREKAEREKAFVWKLSDREIQLMKDLDK